MKNIFSLILILLFSFTILIFQFRLSFYVLEYSLDNQTFTEKYCENKDKPELKCNGKCHLAKVANDNSKNTIPLTNLLEKEVYYYSTFEDEYLFIVTELKLKVLFNFYKNLISINPIIDTPPPKSYLHLS